MLREKILYENWLKYADAVGDFNPIHRDREAAKSFGLKDVIAPGMYVLSFLQRLGKIRSISAKFLGQVNRGDEIEIKEKGKSINILVQGKPAVRARVYFGEPPEQEMHVPEADYTYKAEINEKKIKDFLESIGIENSERLPEMYLISLSAPALLDYGKKENKIGMHVMQSAEIYRNYKIGEVKIRIIDRGDRHGLEDFDLHWVQDNRCVASGEAKVKLL